MVYNNIYADSLAENISDKVRTQFSKQSLNEKQKKMKPFLKNRGGDISYRKYTKRSSNNEIGFMKFLITIKG